MDPSMQPSTQPIEPARISKRKILALCLILGPTALFSLTVIGYSIANYLIFQTETTTPNESLTAGLNIALFAAGSISIFAFFPALMIGLVLLVVKPKPTVQ